MDESELNNPPNSIEDIEYSGFKIRERYVEVLDLTNKTFSEEQVNSEIGAQEGTTNISTESDTKQSPPIMTQKLELIGQALAKSNTKSQNITDVIAERILHNHLDSPNCKKTGESQLSSISPMTRDVLNNMIIKRILAVDAKVNKKKQTFTLKTDNTKNVKLVPSLNTKYKKSEATDKNLKRSISYSTTNKKCKIKLSTSSAQTNKGRGDCETDCTQTEANREVKEAPVQVDPLNDSKNIQTATITNDIETSTIENIATKFTNTDFYYPAANETTQFFEYMSSSDLFCLEWVNKHLFDMNLSPYTIVVDDKIREISELVTKSSFLTDVDNRREVLAMDYI